MNPLLIVLTPLKPVKRESGWHVLWCAPYGEQPCPENVDEIYVLPETPVEPLCQVLMAIQRYPRNMPVAIITGEALPTVFMTHPGTVMAFLDGENSGALWFPRVEQFSNCARKALLDRNPDHGGATLRDVWYQAILYGMASAECEL